MDEIYRRYSAILLLALYMLGTPATVKEVQHEIQAFCDVDPEIVQIVKEILEFAFESGYIIKINGKYTIWNNED